jgi:predicted nucleotide-binding protein
MTDAELKSKILRHFYEKRWQGMTAIRCSDINLALGAIEFGRICKQLKDLGLIEWKPPGGSMISPEGMGLITAKGVDEIERKSHIQDKPVTRSHMARGKNPNASPPRGRPSVTSEHGISLLSGQITKAEQLLGAQPVNGNDFGSWDNTTRNFVEKAFGENHPNVQGFEYMWAFGNSGWSPAEWAEHYAKGLRAKITALNGYIEELNVEIQLREPITPPASRSAPPMSKKIFIVHGHDSTAREQLELIIHRLGLDPFVLQNTGGGGLTIIEALEQEIGPSPGSARFGIVLLTPDDVGYAKSETVEKSQPRARQNVVLEMGMLIAALGRSHVAILKKGYIEVPSDAQGIIYISFAEHVKESVPKLVDRLSAAGFSLNAAAITKASS